MNEYIALDIGGTKFMVASYSETLKEIKRVKHDTPEDLHEGMDLLHHMIGEVSEKSKIRGIGAAIGGPLDHVKGLVSPLHQHQWRNIPLKEMMEKQWGCPFHVDVDTNVAALGEYHLGNYENEKFLYITLSTGMGGGYIIDGKVYRGFNGNHPEVGHQTINFRCGHPEKVQCECGSPDCLEALVSGNAIKRIYNKPAEELDEGEWSEVIYNLGQGLRNIATIMAPDIIVFGGGISFGAGEPFIRKIEEEMKKQLTLVKPPHLALSKLGYDTAIAGAAYIAKNGL
jgi:predicted NBD/HSP70 family sugar kinase